jgi:hypothetical protein
MPPSRDERLARNEASFRSLNDSLGANVHARLSGPRSADPGFVCECGDEDCDEIIVVEMARYEQVRQDPCLFLVKPGHEIMDVEDVVERDEGYFVVRKHEEVASARSVGRSVGRARYPRTSGGTGGGPAGPSPSPAPPRRRCRRSPTAWGEGGW